MNRTNMLFVISAIFLIIFSLTGAAYAANGNLAYSEGIYWIEDTEDFVKFSTLATTYPTRNYSIKEGADIDMAGKTFTTITAYRGTFDGNNVEIKNLVIENRTANNVTGMFGNLTNATIKNVKLSNVTVKGYIPPVPAYKIAGVGVIAGTSNLSVIKNVEISGFNISGHNNSSAVVGYANNTKISDIKLFPYANGTKSKLTSEGNSTGGIVGASHNTAIENVLIENIKIESTKNDVSAGAGQGGNVTLKNVTVRNSIIEKTGEGASSNYGMVGGSFIGGSTSSFVNCHVYDCEVNVPDGFSVGGLIGQFAGGTLTAKMEISDCSVTNTSVIAKGPVGGLIGILGPQVKVLRCTVENGEKTIESDSAIYTTGGFIGQTYSNTVIQDCYANTNIISNSRLTGGFIGMGQDYSGVPSYTEETNITNCSASGTIESNGKQTGGFIGYAGTSIKIENSYADVQISNSTENAGGFAGRVKGTITNSYSTGNVITDADYAGGFAGMINGTVSNCYATGDVEGFNAGGFAGQLNGGSIENVYSTGSVTGLLAAGGFIGEISSTGNEIKNIMALGIDVISDEADCLIGIEKSGSSYTLQNAYVWNGIKAQNRSISNKAADNVTFVKSYNVWDAFDGSNPESISSWDGSWDGSAWVNNAYDTDNTFLLPVLEWQAETPAADASHLLYLTEIDIEPKNLTAKDNENEANFEMTLDALEIRYSQMFYPEWEWDLYLAYSSDENGHNTPTVSSSNIDRDSNPYQTGKQFVSETEPYAWGIADLDAAGRVWSIDMSEYFYKTVTYHKNDGGSENADGLFVEGGVLRGKTKNELGWENNGLTIVRWNNLPDGTGNINNTPGQKTGPLTDDLELYAQWGTVPENTKSGSNSGLKIIDKIMELAPGSESETASGFETKLPEAANTIVVLMFVLAIAVFAFVFKRENDPDEEMKK